MQPARSQICCAVLYGQLALLPPPIPSCDTHYAIDWGIFESTLANIRHVADAELDTDAANEAAEFATVQKLVGYIFARRVGICAVC